MRYFMRRRLIYQENNVIRGLEIVTAISIYSNMMMNVLLQF